MYENGELLADLCATNSLVIGGTLFPHKNCHKATWVSPAGNAQNKYQSHCYLKKMAIIFTRCTSEKRSRPCIRPSPTTGKHPTQVVSNKKGQMPS